MLASAPPHHKSCRSLEKCADQRCVLSGSHGGRRSQGVSGRAVTRSGVAVLLLSLICCCPSVSATIMCTVGDVQSYMKV